MNRRESGGTAVQAIGRLAGTPAVDEEGERRVVKDRTRRPSERLEFRGEDQERGGLPVSWTSRNRPNDIDRVPNAEYLKCYVTDGDCKAVHVHATPRRLLFKVVRHGVVNAGSQRRTTSARKPDKRPKPWHL